MSLLGRREFLIGGAGAVLLGTHRMRAASEDPELHVPVGWPTRPAPASPRRSLASVVMPPNRADS
jgi:hypothetical protein